MRLQSLILYAQGCVRKFAALQHAPLAAGRENPAWLHTGVQMKYVSKLTDARCAGREDKSSLPDCGFRRMRSVRQTQERSCSCRHQK